MPPMFETTRFTKPGARRSSTTGPVGRGRRVRRFVPLGRVVALAVVVSLAMAACAADDPLTFGGGGDSLIARGGGSSASALDEPTEIDVSLSEFKITGSEQAPIGPITLIVTNDGAIVHNLAVRGLGEGTPEPGTPDLVSGEQAVLVLDSLPPGSYEFYCTIPGHLEAGMLQAFNVIG